MIDRTILLSTIMTSLVVAACDHSEPEQGNVAGGSVLELGRGLYEVELDGEIRLVAFEAIAEGVQGVTVQDEDEALLAAARCEGDEVVPLNLDPGDSAFMFACEAEACTADPVTEAVLDAIASGELRGDGGDEFRKISALQWCLSTCVMAYHPFAQPEQGQECYNACFGAFCPVGCW